MMPKQETALTMNAAAAPIAATMTPPVAGEERQEKNRVAQRVQGLVRVATEGRGRAEQRHASRQHRQRKVPG
jgi:hypothetical protein